MTKDYTIILNYYNKSTSLLRNQVNRVLSQTLKPKFIWACFMGGEKRQDLLKAFKEETAGVPNASFILSDYNFKYIGRYQLAITAPTDYVIILDDDRLPETEYCETMISILEKEDCLVQQYGWALEKKEELAGRFLNPGIKNEGELTKASYLCGGICFRKSSLKYLFSEDIDTTASGEDIMFCMRCEKNGIPIYVYSPKYKHKQWLTHQNEGVNYTLTTPEIIKLRTQIIKKESKSP